MACWSSARSSAAAGDSDTLSTPWLLAAPVLGGGAAFVWLIRVDPIAIGRRLQDPARFPLAPPPRDLRAARAAAFAAALVAYVVMASSMPLMAIVMHHRGHDLVTSRSRSAGTRS